MSCQFVESRHARRFYRENAAGSSSELLSEIGLPSGKTVSKVFFLGGGVCVRGNCG